jgi:hypothetical protein
MDWANERYVRLYTRDSADVIAVQWQGRLVLYELLRKVDRAGVLEHGGDLDLLPELLRIPADIFTLGLERLARRGVITMTAVAIILPNYLDAQEATWTSAQRMRELRARRRERSLAPDGSTVTTRNGGETGSNQSETSCNERVTDVTLLVTDSATRRALPDKPEEPDREIPGDSPAARPGLDSPLDASERQANRESKTAYQPTLSLQAESQSRTESSQEPLGAPPPSAGRGEPRKRPTAQARSSHGGPMNGSPLPFTVSELLDAVGEASGGRVITSQFQAEPRRWAIRITAVIRELQADGCTLDDVRRAAGVIRTWKRARDLGWLARPGELVKLVADAGRARREELPRGMIEVPRSPR